MIFMRRSCELYAAKLKDGEFCERVEYLNGPKKISPSCWGFINEAFAYLVDQQHNAVVNIDKRSEDREDEICQPGEEKEEDCEDEICQPGE